MKYKKILKIICINLLIFVSLLAMSEFVLFHITKNKMTKKFKIRQEMYNKNGSGYTSSFKYYNKSRTFNYNIEKLTMRKPEGLNYKKPPILIFGCSYAYGDGLDNKETFSYKLSQLSKRPVYNRSVLGWGTQHILYQLRRDDFYKEIQAPEYIIYTFVNFHIDRLFNYQFAPPSNSILLRYKLTKKGFEEIQPLFSPLWSLYTVNRIQSVFVENVLLSKINREKKLEYFYLMMKECKRIANKHYPDTKFVILEYREYSITALNDNHLRQKLLDDGFIIINSDDLIQKGLLKTDDYKTIDHIHPSGKVWDDIVPPLIKKLNL